MSDPQFIDAPAPKGQFVDAPAPAGKTNGSSGVPLLGRVTPDMSDHDILTNGLGYSEDQAKRIMSAPSYHPGVFQHAVTDPNGFAAAVGHTILGSIYKGALADPSAKLGQLISHGMSALGLNDDRNTELRDALVQLGKANYQQNWKGNTAYNAATGQGSRTTPTDFAGQVVGQAIPFAATGGDSAAATLPAKVLSREALPALGRLATEGAAVGEMQPVDTRDGSFGSQVVKQGVGGALGGVAGGIVGQKVLAPLAGKVMAIAKGNLDPRSASLQQLADSYNIPMSVGDLTQNPGIQRTENTLGHVPLSGMNAFRKGQMEAAQGAAQGLKDKLTGQMMATPWAGVEQVQQAAAQGNPVAKALLAKIETAGDDWQQILQASGNLKQFQTKLQKDALYSKAAQLGDQAGNVPVDGFLQKVDQAIAENQKSALPDKQLDTMLNTLKTQISSGQADTSFTGLQRLRSDLGDMVSDYYKGANGLTGSKGVGVFQGLKGALENDLDKFASNGSPELKQAWGAANEFYKNNYLPYRNKKLADALKDAPADTVYGAFIKNQTTPGQAQKFYQVLDPKGQAAVRAGMVQDAMDAATDPLKQTFSPTVFANALQKKQGAAGVFFKGQDKFELDGLTKVLSNLSNAAKFSANPVNGSQLFLLGEGALAASHPGLGAGTIAAGPLTKALLTTPAGKRILLAASSAKDGSPMMNNLVQKALSLKASTFEIQPLRSGLGYPLPQAADSNPNSDETATIQY